MKDRLEPKETGRLEPSDGTNLVHYGLENGLVLMSWKKWATGFWPMTNGLNPYLRKEVFRETIREGKRGGGGGWWQLSVETGGWW